MKVKRIPIHWTPQLPVFASESFLKAVGDDCGWLGGFDDSGILRCILPYTIVRKTVLRLVRFRVATIPAGDSLTVEEETSFLNGVVSYFRDTGADVIIPATTNTIFRCYPDGADAAPYGSYVIDLSQPEEALWRNIDRITRQNINTSKKKGVAIQIGNEHLDAAYLLIRETFERSNLPFMSYGSFQDYLHGLGNYGRIMAADCNGSPQSYAVFAFSDYCAYAVYAGNAADQQQGANKLLYWEAIRYFKGLGVRCFDFVGARINPEQGSKQDSINALKRRFGAKLVQGYIWKFPLSPFNSRLYDLAARWRSGGDIVDMERHKLPAYIASASETQQ